MDTRSAKQCKQYVHEHFSTDWLLLVALRSRTGDTTFFRRPTVMQSAQSNQVFMHNLVNVKRSEAQAPHYETSEANRWT